MSAWIGIFATLFRWAGALKGLWGFIIPFWGWIKGRFGRRAVVSGA